MNQAGVPNPVLHVIRQTARSGDTQRSWEMFVSAGLLDSDEAEALSLKGRLLKDRAMRTSGATRAELLEAASGAYLRAAGDRRATYPLINAATIAFLGGDRAKARDLARHVLDLLESGDHEPETRYWLGATRAEAQLLLGNGEACREALGKAIMLEPGAWEDQAATLRQFARILEASGQDSAILDGFAPPPSLYFSGIIHLGTQEEAAREAIERALDEIRPGAVFGALAAGVDIVLAECALARGAELHVVLPCSCETFRRISVNAHGEDWGRRFDALAEQAHDFVVPEGGLPLSHAGIEQAAEVAMGLALRRADALATDAISLRISRPGWPVSPSEAIWRGRGLAYRECFIEQVPAALEQGLPAGRSRSFVASQVLGAGPLPEAAILLPPTPEGFHVLVMEDPVEAMRFAVERVVADPSLQFGFDCRSLDDARQADDRSLEDGAGLAIQLARAAGAGEICGPWPQVAMFDLLAAQHRFETAGEIVTPYGDVAIGRLNCVAED